MTALEQEILGLPKLQKVRIMEQIWVDLLKEEDNIEMPEWHLEELANTEKSIQEGMEHFLDWEVAKRRSVRHES